MHLCILHASIHASHTCVGAHIPQCACGGQRQLLWGFVSCPSLVTHDVLAFEVVRFGDSSFTLFMVVITVTVTYCYVLVNVCWTQAVVMPQQACGSRRTALWSCVFFMVTCREDPAHQAC